MLQVFYHLSNVPLRGWWADPSLMSLASLACCQFEIFHPIHLFLPYPYGRDSIIKLKMILRYINKNVTDEKHFAWKNKYTPEPISRWILNAGAKKKITARGNFLYIIRKLPLLHKSNRRNSQLCYKRIRHYVHHNQKIENFEEYF